MKSLLITIAAITLFCSCRKQYVCNCTYPTAHAQDSQNVLLEPTSKDATATCKVLSADAAKKGGSCTLK